MAFRILPALSLGFAITGFLATPSVQAQEHRGTLPLAVTDCAPIDVAEYPNRIHVRCSVPVNGIEYFVATVGNANRAARQLALLSTALVAGMTLVITYDPADTSGGAIGCLPSDCRLIQSIGLH